MKSMPCIACDFAERKTNRLDLVALAMLRCCMDLMPDYILKNLCETHRDVFDANSALLHADMGWTETGDA